MKKNKNFIILLMFIFISFTLLIACNNEENKQDIIQTPKNDISSWANAKVENVLISIDKEDYNTFSKDFSKNMKAQLNEEIFNEQLLTVSELIGDYIKESKKILTTEELEENNVRLIYSTDYSNEEKEVIITIVFNKDSKNVEGLFMNSEKIQKMK